MKKYGLRILIVLVTIMLMAVTVTATACSDTQKPTDGDQSVNALLGSFETTDLDGKVVTQEIFKQYDIIVLNVWGTFCGPCLQEMPDLGALAKEYAPQGLAIIGLVSDTVDFRGNLVSNQVDLARDIVESTGADYLHLLPSSDDDLARLLQGVQYLPTTYFLTSEGVKLGVEVGAKSIDKWRDIFDDLLGK